MKQEQKRDIYFQIDQRNKAELDAAEIYIKRIIDTRENFCA